MVIIIALFFVQSRGTAIVAAWFGPIMTIWFFVMALGGVIHVADNLKPQSIPFTALPLCLRTVRPGF
jgi:K+ transporter